MACKSCTETQYKTSFYAPYPDCNTKNVCSDNCKIVVDTSCIVYTGPQLINIGLDTNVCLETILQEIDQKLIVVTGNYAGYDTACLSPTSTEQEFVETISQYVCDTQDQLNNFITNLYPVDLQGLQDQIDDILQPNITSCASVGIIETDSYTAVLQKLATNECSLYSLIDLSSANWSECFTLVGDPPSTPLEATNALLSMICQVKSGQGTSSLPLFNNLNTCLTGGTSTDTLATTINLMRNRLCQTPILDINTLTFGCTSKPSNNALDLQGTLQAILNKLDGMSKNFPSFNTTDFTSAFTDPSNQCLGRTISLNTSIQSSDRLVATTVTDNSPGTLIDKLTEGNGIILDFTTSPGQVIVGIDPNFTGGDERVKSYSGDPTAGYLQEKIKATGDPSLNLGATLDLSDNKINVTGSINVEVLTGLILEVINNNPSVKEIFCNLVNTCPVACAAPTNASVSFT